MTELGLMCTWNSLCGPLTLKVLKYPNVFLRILPSHECFEYLGCVLSNFIILICHISIFVWWFSPASQLFEHSSKLCEQRSGVGYYNWPFTFVIHVIETRQKYGVTHKLKISYIRDTVYMPCRTTLVMLNTYIWLKWECNIVCWIVWCNVQIWNKTPWWKTNTWKWF